MIKFATHWLISFQVLKALQHASYPGKWYTINSTTGKPAQGERWSLFMENSQWIPETWTFSHLFYSHENLWINFFFSAPLLFPSSLFAFLALTPFSVNAWLFLTAQPLSCKQICIPDKLFSDFWTPTCVLAGWETYINTQEHWSHTAQENQGGSGVYPDHAFFM